MREGKKEEEIYRERERDREEKKIERKKDREEKDG